MLPDRKIKNDILQSILIVDDNAMILELLSRLFKKYGFKVYQAENGLEAWNIFKHEQVDFVLTDIWMPNLDGKELSTLIRNRSQNTIIAVMTGGDFDVAMDLLNDGTVNHFFPKPLKINDIYKSFMTLH